MLQSFAPYATLRRANSLTLVVACALNVILSYSLRAAAPVNDNFSNRIVLAGTNITATGSNINATKQPGEPDHAGNPGGQSVWWSWTAPTNGDLTITTDGSTNADGSFLDTLLAVYTGTAVSSLSVVASNDDHGVLVTSRVRFQAVQGTSYQIAVDGFNDGTMVDSGYITLNLTFISEPIVRPLNDNFTNRIFLSGETIITSGANVLATREAGEPIHAGKLGDTSVWWGWTAPNSTNVTVSTFGSSFDTLLAIYTGSSLMNLTLVANDDDIDPADGILSSTATFDAVAGQAYQIAVDGFDGASGQIVLRISPSQRAFLSAPKRLSDGTFQFFLNGQIGQAYEIDSSSNLTSWAAIAIVASTNASIALTDSAGTNLVSQFYRAVQLP